MRTQKIQEWIVERRRLQQRSDSVENSSRDLVRTADDLAAKLRAFASDPIVVKHFIDFALPPKKRAEAAEVTAKTTWAAGRTIMLQSRANKKRTIMLQSRAKVLQIRPENQRSD